MAEVPVAVIWIAAALGLVAVTIALSARGRAPTGRAARNGRNGDDSCYPFGADAGSSGGDCGGADGGCGGGD